MNEVNAILIMLFLFSWLFAAICNAVMDVLAFKYKRSIFKNMNPNFWNPSISWRNKYKDNDERKGPAFLGSTTFLVFTTDAWHLFQFLSNSFIILGILFIVNMMYDLNWWMYLSGFVILKTIWGFVFETFYEHIFRVKK